MKKFLAEFRIWVRCGLRLLGSVLAVRQSSAAVGTVRTLPKSARGLAQSKSFTSSRLLAPAPARVQIPSEA